jgi:hypothetical protein
MAPSSLSPRATCVRRRGTRSPRGPRRRTPLSRGSRPAPGQGGSAVDESPVQAKASHAPIIRSTTRATWTEPTQPPGGKLHQQSPLRSRQGACAVHRHRARRWLHRIAAVPNRSRSWGPISPCCRTPARDRAKCGGHVQGAMSGCHISLPEQARYRTDRVRPNAVVRSSGLPFPEADIPMLQTSFRQSGWRPRSGIELAGCRSS